MIAFFEEFKKRHMEGEHLKKIRKRGCSSTSSSPLVRRYRFKRAILVGKKGGSTISPSPSPTMQNKAESSKPPSAPRTRARKIDGAACPSPSELEAPPFSRDEKSKEKARRLPKSGSLPAHLSDPSYSPISERMMDGHRRVSAVPRKIQMTDYYMDSPSNGSFAEAENHAGCMVGVKTRLKDVSNSLTTSKELLKALRCILSPDAHNLSSLSLVSALRSELDHARLNVDHLTRELKSNRNDIDHLMKHFAEEKAAWKRKERERTHNSIASIAEELEIEKKSRKQTERLNQRLGKELADTKATLSKALNELDSEKTANEILEQVCDELATGIGDDRAEVELLKQESEKVWEEVEKEREMLQMADVLREERVQMKLSEAKYQFEEKNSAVERLRNQLEAYMETKNDDHWSPKSERSKKLHDFLSQTHFGNGREEEDSAESDMHSIELDVQNSNIDDWSYGYGEEESKRSSADKIQWGSICLKNGDVDDKERSSEKGGEEMKRYKSLKKLRDRILWGSKTGLQQVV